ncbi:hypothetical protein ABIA32_006115 [Streptacidiphilus sp. MAP12-20]|jgi:hypothetical protein|uniref:hypothetical protein n=1 Tax=Streptacidiphilus TaxID=228398 RepID=UPI0005A7DA4D|nr:hypothetical protein [Streptacidiphilus melanogenes]
MSAVHHLVELAANGNIGGLVNGVAPNWGPFSALGNTAKTVIDIVMAAVISALLGRAALGSFHIKIGEGQNDIAQVSKGKKEVAGSLIGAFVVASLGTVFTIVYGMGI